MIQRIIFPFLIFGLLNRVLCDGGGWGAPNNNNKENISLKSPGFGTPQTETDKYWWLKSTPFKKPSNHPGVERGDTSTHQNNQKTTHNNPSNHNDQHNSPQNYNTPQNNGQSYNPPQNNGQSYNPPQNNAPNYNAPNEQSYNPPQNNAPNFNAPNRQSYNPPQNNAPNYNIPQNSAQIYSPPQNNGQNYKNPQNFNIEQEIRPNPNGYYGNSNNNPIETGPDCMLKNKADCHKGGHQIESSYNIQNSPQNSYNQQREPSYEKNPAFSNQQIESNVQGTNREEFKQFERPSTNYQTPSNTFSSPNNVNLPFNLNENKVPFSPPSTPYKEPSKFGGNLPPYRPQINQNYVPNNFNTQQQVSSVGQNPNNNFEEQVPYPGCPAAMLCVPESFCDAKGVSAGKPLSLSPAEKRFQVALMSCSAPMTGEVGVCCRDPDYKDPWPMDGTHHDHNDKKGKGFDDGQYHPPGSSHHSHQHSQQQQNSPTAFQPPTLNGGAQDPNSGSLNNPPQGCGCQIPSY